MRMTSCRLGEHTERIRTRSTSTSRASDPPYSDPFIDWIVEEYARDNDFFANSRAHYYASQKG